ncbi:IS200/IS605 family transposase [Candidatus Bathyarchaeota archaeon]|nr:IS200/IS605 family transposase [Candidatus Bathyarchaeota archaeon]MBS7618049.1 IS200/IS605 family transposase [Candidatus Bathyarchaeota archaeon]
MQSCQHSRNKVFLIQYHLVWCPKRRKPVLVGKVKERLEQIIRQVAEELGIKVSELAINPDHVHLFISAYPTIPVHKIVRKIKGRSSNILRREFPELLKLPALWTHSYYVSTIGAVSKETIEKYIEAQRGV